MTGKTRRHQNRELESLNNRCYVIYGKGFNPMKLKGHTEKEAFIKRLKAKGFHPSASLLSDRTRCTRKATLYNRIPGWVTIR